MANPAPTINQINAFNATQGTTIDFNIIGGTELVRSNKIYIYDLSDNSLICTHLYVSTESIHELPANTDSSIVYESGKSSADFVNGAQYYAQIQTYTDTAGTEGGSGLSVAKMFWCLVDPTLTIDAIPSTISTTSYNVSATYTDTSASVVSNIIQQYQFNLYSAVGSLLQSSGVVVGSGEQQGTSTAYDISYNFTGLNVGSSYYVTVEVTTTQGMSVSAQSNTFTVSIDTPTLGEATVVNNACDGYISVTSNLSGEYGGSGSGDIVTFETTSVNEISSLKVNIEPIQDLSHGDPSPSNICPISGHTEVVTQRTGKNLLSYEVKKGISTQPYDASKVIKLNANQPYTISYEAVSNATTWRTGLVLYDDNGERIYTGNDLESSSTLSRNASELYYVNSMNGTLLENVVIPRIDAYGYFFISFGDTVDTSVAENAQIELGTTATAYEPYEGETYTTSLGQTVYGGTVDLVSGVLTVDRAMVDLGSLNWNTYNGKFTSALNPEPLRKAFGEINMLCSIYKTGNYGSSASQGDGTIWLSASTSINTLYVEDSRYSDPTAFKQAMNGVQLCYELATPQTIQLTPQEIQTLVGVNNVWADSGDVSVTYNIPITNLLVKRQDTADISGKWLTLYSQPITQASDMNFTFIDFTNQYGKTYKYALVPLLTQTQSGVEVEVEGGYTVSDEVQSIFDGVFIADSTGSQKCKANVGYGNVDMNQVVGSITPIGAKYPIVITNSQNQYHNGSISGTIVPDDYYFNGNLSRIDMVNKRNELEQFLTNKRAKIIKDWNGNIWLAMIMDNVSCTFNNNYGMGIVNFSTNWIEVGDPTNQQDLQATGLINVGGA